MGANTKIEWCDFTFNPWRGCQKVAAGCANCYAEAQSKRNPKTLGVWGPNGSRVVASESMWREPLKWERAAECHNSFDCSKAEHGDACPQSDRPRVFCGSLCDVFEDWRLPVVNSCGEQLFVHVNGTMDFYQHGRQANLDDVRARLFSLIDQTPNLDWLLLTKRPENVRRMWPTMFYPTAGAHGGNFLSEIRLRCLKNVWLGTSIACQEDADRNVPELLKCRDLAAKLFLSIEPLVGPVDLEKIAGPEPWKYASALHRDHDDRFYQLRGAPVDFVICGGESGPNARPCDIAWIRSIVRQCRAAGVPVFVKQLGASPTEYVVTAIGQDAYGNVDDDGRYEVMKLRDPKGGDPAEWPEDVRVREVP